MCFDVVGDGVRKRKNGEKRNLNLLLKQLGNNDVMAMCVCVIRKVPCDWI